MSERRAWRILRRLGAVLAWALAAAVLVWSVGAVRYSPVFGSAGSWWAWIATVGYVVGVGIGIWRLIVGKPAPTKPGDRLSRWHGARWLAVPVLVVMGGHWFVRPRNDRDWAREVSELPYGEVVGEEVRVRNLRSCVYRSTSDFDVRYRDETFDLRQLNAAWFIVEPFGGSKRLAHTLLSFGFEDGRCVAVSVEVRREKGETYSPLRGLYRNYELTYVIGDESDLVRLRTTMRGDDVYLYPIRSSPTRLRAMFLQILDRAGELRREPEFYNTLTNTCTTAIMEHANRVSAVRVPWGWGIVLPADSDRLAWELGLIPNDVTLEELRKRSWISGRAREWDGSGRFEEWVRGK